MYGSEQTMAMARVLLERGADPNAINRMGNVPLSEAVVNNKMEFVKLLLEFGVGFFFCIAARILYSDLRRASQCCRSA
jgi:ankyrin repeat protein